MTEIFLHLQSQQFEIGGIAKDDRHLYAMLFIHRDSHGHIDESRKATPHACFHHKG